MSAGAKPPTTPPLTVAQLAERWSLTEKALHRRLKQIHLPSINVGTAKDPQYLFRLATVEAWEAANEVDRSMPVEKPQAEVRIPAGAPAGWDGFDPWTKGKAKNGGGRKR